MHDLLLRARLGLRAATRAIALSVVGTIFTVVAIAFFTVALWVWITGAQGPLAAALVIGAVYLAIGLVLFALASRPARVPPEPVMASAHPRPRADPVRGSLPTLMEGFILGIEAGRLFRSLRRR